MKKISTQLLLLLAGMICALPFSKAQDFRNCYTVEANEALRAQNPGMETPEEFENWLAPLVRQYHQQGASQRAVVTIPIVFHIIHNGESVGSGDNISATYVNAQIDQLNNDFRRILGTSGYNTDPAGADTEIEFCAATVDPSGNTLAEPGINRINRSSFGWTAPPYGTCTAGNFGNSYIENTIKPQSQWNPGNYLNVWVMDMVCGILGYAQFPSSSGLSGLNANGGAASTDGVVLLPTSLGSTTTPFPNAAPYNEGRTGTHEIGHFFGLRHIWGDASCGTDYCADTPTQQGPSSGCPNTTTCDGVNDMVENYMDYSYDDCMNIFTSDQKARMLTVLANSPRRGSLTTSTACSGGGGGGLTCSSTVSSYPYSESFESGTGNWTQGSGDDMDWTRDSGGTPSTGTGPTSGAAGNWYMYTEASSPNYPSKVANFVSPCFDMNGLTDPEISFSYHMYGSAIGTLNLQASTDGTSWLTVWTLSGNQGNAWNSATVDLSAYAGQSQVVLRYNATTGSSWAGDISVDNISVQNNSGGGGGGPTCTDITLTIVLDNYPEETSWTITDGGGATVASGGTYGSQPDGSTVTVNLCLDEGCYDFTINDAYGDGICCAYGNGSYNLTEDGTGTSLASGGSFGSSETTNFCLGGGGGGGSCPAIDFNAYTISSYGAGQDAGSFQVQDGGATLYIANNAWKSIPLNYTITANTVIEFDFQSTLQGEIHGIGFDTDDAISSNLTFKVHGTQNWGITTYDNYSGSGWTTYTIPVGSSYTGASNRLFFVADHDGSPQNGNSYFRNVKIYEGSCGTRTSTVTRQTLPAHEMTVYPNPVNDQLFVAFTQKESSTVDISVVDMMGRKVLTEMVSAFEGENVHQLSVQSLAKGTYMVVVNDGVRTQTRRVVVMD